MRTIPLIQILALVLIFVAPAAHAQVDVALVEGHVFGKFTGVPLRGAVVEAFEIVAFPLPPLIPVASVITNESGFYSFEADAEFDLVIVVSCGRATVGVPERLRSTEISPIRPGTIRRDVYLKVGRRRSFGACPIQLEAR